MSDKLIAYVNQKFVTHMYIILDLRKPWIVLTIKFCFQRHFTIEHKGSLSKYSHTNNKKTTSAKEETSCRRAFAVFCSNGAVRLRMVI